MRTHQPVLRTRHRSKQVILMQVFHANTVLDTLNKVEAEALVYTQPHKFPQVQAKTITDTFTGLNRR